MPTQGDPPSPPSPSPQKIPVADDVDPDENIPHATLELYRHTALRGANLGAVLALVFGPPVLLYRGVRKPYEMMKRLGSASLKGVGIGIGAITLLTFIKIHDQNDEQIYDRSYRIRKNKGQCRTDRFTYIGALLGGAAGAASMPGAMVMGALQGASMGMGLAVFAHVMTSKKDKKEG